MAEMYCRNDTFLLLFYGRDILCSLEKEDAKMELKMGLEMSFGNNHYFKTRDSLYIYTGKYHDAEIYYYKIYVPEKMVSFSVRSKNNDNVFSKKSKWLLSQIRLNRRRELYLINEKNKLCMDPFGDQE